MALIKFRKLTKIDWDNLSTKDNDTRYTVFNLDGTIYGEFIGNEPVLDAHNTHFNGSGTNYLVNKPDVESAVKELDTQVKGANDTKADKTYVDAQDKILDDRIDNIIAGTIEGASAQEIIDARDGETVLLNKLQKMNFGEVGKNYKIVAGVIRNTGTGWEFINDGSHEPINSLSVETLTNSIKINYAFTGVQTISFLAVPDEELARRGFIMGSSVHSSYAEIFLRKMDNVTGYITKSGGSTPVFTADFRSQGITLLEWKDNSLEITHDKCYNYSGISTMLRNPEIKVIVSSMDGNNEKTIFRFYDNSNNLIIPPDGTVLIFNRVGGGNVPPTDVIYPFSNIWFYGIMKVA